MTIYEEIKGTVQRFHAVHRYVLALYLSICYGEEMSFELAEKSIHKAALGRYCYEDGDFITESPHIKPNAGHAQMSRAFRVALEFMNYGEYSFLDRRVIRGNDANTLLMVLQPTETDGEDTGRPTRTQLIQISYIPRGGEVATSQMLANVSVSKPVKDILRRIAIVETGFRQDYIAKAGYAMFIRFGKDQYTFNSNDVFEVDKETRWADVKET